MSNPTLSPIEQIAALTAALAHEREAKSAVETADHRLQHGHNVLRGSYEALQETQKELVERLADAENGVTASKATDNDRTALVEKYAPRSVAQGDGARCQAPEPFIEEYPGLAAQDPSLVPHPPGESLVAQMYRRNASAHPNLAASIVALVHLFHLSTLQLQRNAEPSQPPTADRRPPTADEALFFLLAAYLSTSSDDRVLKILRRAVAQTESGGGG